MLIGAATNCRVGISGRGVGLSTILLAIDVELTGIDLKNGEGKVIVLLIDTKGQGYGFYPACVL